MLYPIRCRRETLTDLLIRGVLIVVISWTCAATSAHAQTPEPSHRQWLVLGMGQVTSERSPGITDPEAFNLHLSFNLAGERLAYQLGVDYVSHFTLGGTPQYTSLALHPGIGTRMGEKYFFFASFAGPAFIYHTRNTFTPDFDRETVRRIAPGLALDAQFFLIPLADVLPEFGAGMGLFSSLNTVQHYYGFRFSLTFNTVE